MVTEFIIKRAPTLYVIIGIKLVKGLLLVTLGVAAWMLSDNDLPAELAKALHLLHLNPEGRFWTDVAMRIGKLSEVSLRWTALGTLIYSSFSWVEGIGLIFRVSWAGWMAISESAFFIPIEVYELIHKFSWLVVGILAFNALIVWYLLQYRHRLFKHHEHT